MSDPMRYDIELRGCTPEPLMSYLKALGILRLVSEQKDAGARGWWKNDVFWLRSTLDKEALEKFFLDEYAPTPIVGPWAGGSGFFSKDNKKWVDTLATSSVARLSCYREVIALVRAIVAAEGLAAKPADEDKVRVISRYRRELPDLFLAWMDCAMVLRADGQGFAPLLGTGGNDGRMDFTQNFMMRLVTLELHVAKPVGKGPSDWLANALFNQSAQLLSATIGQFSPGRAGGANATHGSEGDPTDNPWDFVLMFEGAPMLGGAASRRFGSSSGTRTVFPFTVQSVAAGFDSPATKDDSESRGELWLPLWDRALNMRELQHLFGEGRSDVSRRPVRDGADFARAVSSLGVARGIKSFTRVGFLKRAGLSFLAAPLGRFSMIERREVDLLRELDPWLDRFRRSCGKKGAPSRFGPTLRAIDASIFDFCRYGGASQFQRILTALGEAEQQLGTAERFRDEHNIKPIAGLSRSWVFAADDQSHEFRLAVALASIHDGEQKLGPLRTNLEAVDWLKGKCGAWAEKDPSVVWNTADFASNLAAVLQRRMMDAERRGCDQLPIASRSQASLEQVSLFLADELDERLVDRLIWGVMLVSSEHCRTNPVVQSRTLQSDAIRTGISLPREYALLKLLFLPRAIIAERSHDNLRFRLAREGESGIRVRSEPRILPLLRAGRVGEACTIAAQRLRVSGIPTIPGPLSTGVMRDRDWVDQSINRRRGERLAASLLIPVSSNAVHQLMQLICRDQSEAADALVTIDSEGDSL